MPLAPPRVTVSAAAGDGAKTLVSIGLIAALRERGLAVAPFKKGPDYIDAAWLTRAAGRQARNLDTFMTGDEGVRRGLAVGALGADVAVIEGNRGLHDGLDASGAHSTAALARLVATPIVLVLDATKATRTLAALALGCQRLEPAVPLAAVVLNRVATARQERVAREAIEAATGLPVLGAIGRREGGGPLPGRHLGLVTPDDHVAAASAIETAREMVDGGVDVDAVLAIARAAPGLDVELPAEGPRGPTTVSIGVVRDAAFSFYYPENLEALERAGATLQGVSSLEPGPLPPDLDGLYVGGGFPEVHAARLASNRELLEGLRAAAERGLPIYAECGGLILLSRSLAVGGDRTFPMAGVFDADVALSTSPRGHGYAVLEVDRPNPFFAVGEVLRGHEFHYTAIAGAPSLPTAFAVSRGTGCFDGRDGLVHKRVLASYTHLHASGASGWAARFVGEARAWRRAGER